MSKTNELGAKIHALLEQTMRAKAELSAALKESKAAFLAEIDEVCKKHGYQIEHEDYDGSQVLLIEKYQGPAALAEAVFGRTVTCDGGHSYKHAYCHGHECGLPVIARDDE